MNVLIIGGTRFQGRYLVDELIKSGHTVTVFHKGNHSIDERCGLTDLIGDRDNLDALGKLLEFEFDACIDTCAYFPQQIEKLSQVLNIRKYCLISTVYVYKDQFTVLKETSELARIEEQSSSKLTPGNYGALKALCEQMARSCFGEACLMIRPSIIIGPGDHTERMSFWIQLATNKHKLVAPGNLERMIQFVDVRDLAEFTVQSIIDGRSGAINVAGKQHSFKEFLDILSGLSGDHCQINKIDWIEFNRLNLNDLPFCYPEKSENYISDLANSWGFRDRGLEDSLHDIYEYDKKRDAPLSKYQDLEQKILNLFS